MTVSPWQRRIQRAEKLAAQHPFAVELLEFYVCLARFQEQLHQQLSTALKRLSPAASMHDSLDAAALSELTARFESFLPWLEKHGPEQLSKVSQDLRARGRSFWSELLDSAWMSQGTSDARSILAQAFLQPYAELLRSRVTPRPVQDALCSFCARKPVVGVLRPKSEGAARSLVCSFCLNEWEFRRIVCPACSEENEHKLQVFTATNFDCIRVECCETCKTYLKAVDLTKNGLAEPIVDELASAPLDLWARDRGYAKLHNNVLGL